MKIIFLLLIITISLVSEGETMGERPNYVTQIKAKMKQVDVSDGVSKEEAVIIAQNDMIDDDGADKVYLNKPDVKESGLVDGCWYVGFDTRFKVRVKTGLEWYGIHIDKKTGEIKGRGWGPS